MYIKEVVIDNIQCFKKAVISLSKDGKPCLLDVILGDNSAGKSCFLRCIAIGLNDQSTAATLMQSLGVDFLRDKNKEGTIEITLIDNESNKEIIVTTKIDRERDVEIIKDKSVDRDESKLWKRLFLCGYGIQRSGEGTESYREYKRLEALLSLFDYYASSQNIELILLRQPEKMQKKILEMVLEVLMLKEKGWTFEVTNKGLKVTLNDKEVMLDALGDGYSSSATWIIDFIGWQIYADRLINADGLKEISGIVLLDELELTLHPSLQRNIVKNLKEQFPNVQFIVTSHSPIIAAGVTDFSHSKLLAFKFENGETRVIEEIPSLQGMSVDQVLSSVAFGLFTTVSVGTVDNIRRFSELMSKRRNEEEEQEYLTLMKSIEEKSHSGTTEAERQIEKAVTKTLEDMLEIKPPKELELLMKEKLKRLFSEV